MYSTKTIYGSFVVDNVFIVTSVFVWLDESLLNSSHIHCYDQVNHDVFLLDCTRNKKRVKHRNCSQFSVDKVYLTILFLKFKVLKHACGKLM